MISRFLSALPVVAGIVVLSASSSAQQRPDFSGTWVSSTDAPPAGIAAAPGGAILGLRFSLKLDGDTLVVTKLSRDESRAVTFKLDGSTNSYRVPGRLCEGDTEATETAAWEGNAIALTATGFVPAGGGPARPSNAKRMLRRDGETLVVQAKTSVGGTVRDVATVYKRSSDPMPALKAKGIKGTAATISQVGWIAGFWSGPNGTNGSVNVEERWTPPASGGMMAMSRTIGANNVLRSFEFLCIAEREGSLVYAAMPDGSTTPTYFTATAVTADSVTFENPAHDYPQLIKYTKRADGSLETLISGANNARPITMVLPKKD